MAEFLGDQCPERAFDLTHMPADDDPDHCDHCGLPVTRMKDYYSGAAPDRSGPGILPPTPVVRLIPGETIAGATEPDDDAPREPKMAEGTYPKRWRHDWGRMPFEESDIKRLLFLLTLRDSHLGD